MDFPEALQTSTTSVSSSLTFPVFSHMQCLELRFFCDEIFGLVSAPCMALYMGMSRPTDDKPTGAACLGRREGV